MSRLIVRLGRLDQSRRGVKRAPWYFNEKVRTPKISITPLVEPYRVITIGPTPTYFINRILQIHVWVRPPTSSNTALGQAKNARYQMGTEIERIIRSGSTAVEG